MDFTTQTPAEIDTEMVNALLALDRAVGHCYHFEPKAVGQFYWHLSADSVDFATKAIEEAIAAREILDAVRAEYTRRGGWERYIIVPDGHVHYGRFQCPTLDHGERPTDRRFVPHLSAMTEAQMVEAVGETACTVCFPTAPAMPAFQAGLRRTADEKVAARTAKLVARRAKLSKTIDTKTKTLGRLIAKGESHDWETKALAYAVQDLADFDRKNPGLVATSPAA
jgi:hypothetical protein